ncbi:hypothetical protein DRJ22_02985 [Candidatus Woesearchaeota archaeon]|nr:MAG: hypothetical protein DRJ22_02985 [Candidatus Woesearchaeota archaeon]
MVKIGQGIDNKGVFYLVPNALNGIVCRDWETAKRIKNLLQKFKDTNKGIEIFSYYAFHLCPEEEEDCFKWALGKLEKML